MDRSKQNVRIEKEREVNTYVYMWRTSRCLLEKGLQEQKGSFHQFMASLVFTAFTLEAYLNHIGPQIFKCWDDLERKLNPVTKLNLIAEKIGLKIDYGRRPYQSVKDLFRFRNTLAHGKSQTVKNNKDIPLHGFSDQEFGRLAQTKYEKYCTKKNAQMAIEDVEIIIKEIHEIGRFEPRDPFFSGIQLGSAKLESDE